MKGVIQLVSSVRRKWVNGSRESFGRAVLGTLPFDDESLPGPSENASAKRSIIPSALIIQQN